MKKNIDAEIYCARYNSEISNSQQNKYLKITNVRINECIKSS